MWKYARYGLLLSIGGGAIASIFAGGGWMWCGFVLAVLLALGGDALFGDDLSEPSYGYKWLLNVELYANLPMLLLMTFAFAWQLSPRDLFGIGELIESLTGHDALAAKATNRATDLLGAGLGLGLFYGIAGTNVGHELTHRTWSKPAQIVGRWLLAFTSDASFAIEHVYGHHKHVATYADAATARRGESSWRFVVRSTIGSYLGAWRIERERLERQGRSVWSWRNKMHRGNLMTLAYASFFFFAAGWQGAIAFMVVSLYGKTWLELVNYMEHYGIVRVPGAPVEPRHSWNCNRRISGYLLYNLTRHSHHHAMGEKPFWELRAYPDTPMMPYGYLSMIIIAMCPPLWNRLIIPRVLAWDRDFADESERALIAEANARSGHAWFQGELPSSIALPSISSDPLPEAEHTDLEDRPVSNAGEFGSKILRFLGTTSREVRVEGVEVDFEVEPGQTILTAALDQGINFPHNCRVGGCAECKCKLLTGKVRELTDASYILSADDLREGYVLACQSVPRTHVVVEVPESKRHLFVDEQVIFRVGATISALKLLTRDIMEVTLTLKGPVSYRAGQYMELVVPSIIEEPRAYSCASAIEEGGMTEEVRFHVRHVPGGQMSTWVHEQAHVGASVALRGPFGQFHLREPSHHEAPIVAIAGGSGMAPLLAMFEGASAQQRRRDVRFYFGARTRDDLYDRAMIDAIAATWRGSFEYIEVLSEESIEGVSEWVTDRFARDERDVAHGAQLYMCGPPAMIDHALSEARALGWSMEDVHYDKFTDRSHLVSEAPESMSA